MAWILNALHSVQDHAFRRSTPAPTASCEPVKKLNDSVYELCNPSRIGRPSVEIVFFHGLQFDGSNTTFFTTWLSRDGQASWLPWIFEIFPEARILLISYNGCTRKKDDEGCADMYITSENLWQDMVDDNARVGRDGCPVVLVGHSLGGLVIKEVFMKANSMLTSHPHEKVKENLGFLLQNVKHLFYYACPHNGTRLADIETKFLKGRLFEHLTILNYEVARGNQEFERLRQNSKWKAFSIGEGLPTDLGQLGRHIVVEEASARYDTDVYYTADADHINVCRPGSKTDASFLYLKDVINQALAADVKGHKVSTSRDQVVGLNDQVRLVRRKLENVKQVGLFGPGGIGKTTLAELVYDDMSDNFEYTCFVREVKGTVPRNARLRDLQAEILKNIYYKGRRGDYEWSQLEGKRAFIVLDDVQYESQVLVLNESGLSSESCVLLTSRDQRNLTSKDFEVHVVDFLDDEASKRLFCRHAFKNADAPEAYKDRVERFTQKCKGWPLVLKVSGKYLYKQEDGRVWDDAFHKLSEAKPLNGKIDDDEFWPIFNVIYSSLQPEVQEMFLDIAICFHDEELESVKRTWRVCRKSADIDWQNLLDMGLVTTTSTMSWLPWMETNHEMITIQMHEVLRDLGRSKTDPENIQNHRVVCYDMDSGPWPFEQGNRTVKILKIVSNSRPYDARLGTKEDIEKLRGLDTLNGLENLKALWLDGVYLHGARNLFPASLVYLKMKAWDEKWTRSRVQRPESTSSSQWIDESTRSLLDVDESTSSSSTFFCSCWASGAVVQPFEALSRRANIEHPTVRHLEIRSLEIRSGRDFGPLVHTLGQPKNLEHLSFEECWYEDLSSTLKQIEALKSLRIDWYRDEVLPDSLADLHDLEHLEIRESPVTVVPDWLGRLAALKSLTIGGWQIETLPDSLGELSALESLTLSQCRGVRALPSTLGQLKTLRRLELRGFFHLRTLPETLSELDGLEHLIIRCNLLNSVPDALGKLQRLKCLEMKHCHYLRALPLTLTELPALRIEIEWFQPYGLEVLKDMLGTLKPLQLQRLTVWSDLDPRRIMEVLGQLDAVKHLTIWIGKKHSDRVKKEIRSQNYFEILPAVGGIGLPNL